jgi:hypothetical protein
MGRAKAVALIIVVACVIALAYLLRDPAVELFSPPPRADIGRLHSAVDSALTKIGPRNLTTSTVDLGGRELTQDDLELSRRSSMLRANLEITRAVERAGGEIAYGIDSSDDTRRWQTVTLGISDGDSLIREVRLRRRLR